MQMQGFEGPLRGHHVRPVAVGNEVKGAGFDIGEPGFPEGQRLLASMVQCLGSNGMGFAQAQDALDSSEVTQGMVATEEFFDQLFDVRTESLGLFLGVMDFKPGHTELGFGVVSVGGGELTRSTKPSMNGNGLAIFVKDLDELLGATSPDLLAHIDEGTRIEVFVHLDVAIGVNLSVAPLAELEA